MPESEPRSGSDLRASVASGVRLTTLQQGFEQVVRLAFTVVLAHFVAPSDFGLMSMAFVVTYLAIMASDLGVGTALVQRPHLELRHITTAFTASSLFGLTLTVAVIWSALPLASFFDEPRLAPILVAMSLTFLCKGVQGAPRDLLRRDMRFVPYTVTATVGLLAGVMAGLALAIAGAGVWALVAYSLVESFLAMTLSLVAARRAGVWRPAVGVDPGAFRDLAGFTGYVLASRGLLYAQNTADNVVVGRLLGASALGFYGLAYRTMLFPIQKIADVVSSVALPALASVQNDTHRLRRAFVRIQQAAALVSFPLSLGIVAVAPLAVPVVLGGQWRPATATIQILALNGPRLVLNRLAASAFQATGRPSWDFALLAVGLPLSLIGFVIGARHGIAGVAVGFTVAGFVMLPAQLLLLARVLDTTVGRILATLKGVTGATAVMLAAVALTLVALPAHVEGSFRLAVAVAVGVVVYATSCLVLAPGLLAQVVCDISRRRPRTPSPAVVTV